MENKKKSLFREKSMESIESPEVLNQYLRVTSPSVWIIFGAVIMILIGGFVWSVFGTIETTATVAVVIEEEYQCALVPAEALQTVISERTIIIDGQETELAPKSIEPVVVADDWDVYVILAGNLKTGDIVYPIPVKSELNDGVYTGTIVTESISPISFLFN